MEQPDNIPDRTEALLVEQATKGDAESFARLYDTHVNRVYRYILYRVSDTGVAEDLTQEVFLRGWRALPKFRRKGKPFLGWLLTIAHNLVIDHYRSRRIESTLEDNIITAGAAADPQHIAEVDMEQKQLQEAIKQLRPEQQQVIMLRFIEGFEYSEIAVLLGKKEGAIRVIQHRALQKLRNILDKDAGQ